MAESMIARIRRGAALLDKKRRSKAWRKQIDIRGLDMSIGYPEDDECGCMLAQLYGTSIKGSDALGFYDLNADEDAGSMHGFYAYGNQEYEPLTRAWKRYLKAETA